MDVRLIPPANSWTGLPIGPRVSPPKAIRPLAQTKGKTFAELKEALPNLRYQLFVVRDGRIVLPKKKDKKKRRQK